MRMAKYSRTPISYFLNLTPDEFYEWVEVMNAEIKRENKELEKLKNKHRRK